MRGARTYLDPHTYLYTDDEWKGELFTEKLESLVNFFLTLKNEENTLWPGARIFRIQSSDDILSVLYSSNPFLNEPNRNFYFQQYSSAILPEIMRRVVTCPSSACMLPETSSDFAVATNDNDIRDLMFADQLNRCLGCSRIDQCISSNFRVTGA